MDASGNGCLQCVDNCDVCSSQTECETCLYGYLNNNASSCDACVSNCKSCYELDKCKTCDDGY